MDSAQALQRREKMGHLCPAGEWEVGVRKGLTEEAEFGLDLRKSQEVGKQGREEGRIRQIQKPLYTLIFLATLQQVTLVS